MESKDSEQKGKKVYPPLYFLFAGSSCFQALIGKSVPTHTFLVNLYSGRLFCSIWGVFFSLESFGSLFD